MNLLAVERPVPCLRRNMLLILQPWPLDIQVLLCLLRDILSPRYDGCRALSFYCLIV